MKLMKRQKVNSGGVDGNGDVVVVAVKFDAEGRRLLASTLADVARPGDHVIVLHVVDYTTGTDFLAGTSYFSKNCDYLLSATIKICNTKKVNLELKIYTDSSVKNVLVREANISSAAKVIVGTSGSHRENSSSLAQHCAKNLSKQYFVFALSNAKMVFQRKPPALNRKHFKEKGYDENDEFSSEKNSMDLALHLALLSNSSDHIKDGCDASLLSLIPLQHSSTFHLNSAMLNGLLKFKHGWKFLRTIFWTGHRHSVQTHEKRSSLLTKFSQKSSRKSPCTDFSYQRSNTLTSSCQHQDSDLGEKHPLYLPDTFQQLHNKLSASQRLFSYEDLMLATSNFLTENIIGKGGCSHVYKGSLFDGRQVAVKVLRLSEDTLKEFMFEIDIITSLKHKNIISLLGLCIEHGKVLLVYDFFSKGSLDKNLRGSGNDGCRLGWWERYKVAVGTAEAINFLHNNHSQPVIHKDIKSSNILLSDNFEPQLSDFGLANWVSTPDVPCTNITGTFGYLAPEYFMHGRLSDKVDVFAFGVVLLELLSGRLAISSQNTQHQESLVLWARPILSKGKVSDLLDPWIKNDHDVGEIKRMVLAATLCIKPSPLSRPHINTILKLLQGDSEVFDWAKQQINASDKDEDDDCCFPLQTCIKSHLDLAFSDVEDDDVSPTFSSADGGVSLKDFLDAR